jgi:hypothetical protein
LVVAQKSVEETWFVEEALNTLDMLNHIFSVVVVVDADAIDA